MIRLQILQGNRAGEDAVLHRFPTLLGRASENGVRLEDAGVWDRHARIELEPATGFFLAIEPNALGSVNGQPIERVHLRNGDVIDLGSARLRFWLSDPSQYSLRSREIMVWIGILAVILGQALLLYRLLQ